ncbi:MAG TPA: hypothetical protein VII75_00550, partial [Thermoanaerobaculia bacterium]
MSKRQFPAPTFDLYNENAESLLSLAREETSPFQLASGQRLDALGRVRRLFALHRRAMDAERAGVVARADFYWREVIATLRRLWSNEAAWEAAAERAGGSMSGDEARQAVLTEILIDTHRGLFMAYVHDDAKPDNRAFVHGAYVRELVTVTVMPRHRAYAIVRPMVEREIASCRSAGLWEAARALAAWMMSIYPEGEFFHDLAAQIELDALAREMGENTTEASAAREATSIQKTIDRLERSLLKYPTTISFFNALAALYRARAVRLTNSGTLAPALAAIEAALAYGGDDGDAEALKKQLLDLMRQKQEQVDQLNARLRMMPRAQLNANGLRARADADTGRRLAESFRAKERPEIVSERHRAEACTIFRRIGIPAPDEHSDVIADDMRSAFDAISKHPPRSDAELAAIWQEAVTNSPRLASVDRDGVLRFFAHVLWIDPEEEALKELGGRFAPAGRKPGQEPFLMWLYSGRNV